jgi:hypothetical protein
MNRPRKIIADPDAPGNVDDVAFAGDGLPDESSAVGIAACEEAALSQLFDDMYGGGPEPELSDDQLEALYADLLCSGGRSVPSRGAALAGQRCGDGAILTERRRAETIATADRPPLEAVAEQDPENDRGQECPRQTPVLRPITVSPVRINWGLFIGGGEGRVAS